MSGTQGRYISDISDIASIENQLAAVLGNSVNQLPRMEGFDQEQRSEIYTILCTLKSETDAHCRTVGAWIDQGSGRADDA